MVQMPSSLLTLGSFSFDGLEAPNRIVLSSKQRLIVHHLASGLSITDSLGEDCDTASFQGVFAGNNGAERIRLIEYMKSQGAPLPLTWGSKCLIVIIQEFELRYLSNNWVTYKLTCRVTNSGLQSEAVDSDVLLVSSTMRVANIADILFSVGIPLSSTQTSSLSDLAAMNFDAAPSHALEAVQMLINTVNESIAMRSLGPSGPAAITSGLESINTYQLAEIIENLGLLATLLISHDRLADLAVRAIAVNDL